MPEPDAFITITSRDLSTYCSSETSRAELRAFYRFFLLLFFKKGRVNGHISKMFAFIACESMPITDVHAFTISQEKINLLLFVNLVI